MAPASKRAASSAAQKGRPAKAKKVATKQQKMAPAAPAETPAARAVAALLRHLGGGGSAPSPSSVIQTFRASLPHAVAVAKEDRHPFQHSVVQSFEEYLAAADMQHVQELDDAKAKAAAHDEHKASVGAKIEALRVVEERTRVEQESAKALSRDAEAMRKSASSAAEAAKQSFEEAEAAIKEAEAEREKFEETLKSWEPLKNSEFKDWRERKKAAEQIIGLLRQASKTASLIDALPAALKEKCEARSSFTQQVLAHAESALTGHVAVLAARIEERRAAAAAKAEAATQADRALEEASARLSAAQEASFEAQNSWVEAQGEWFTLKTHNFEHKDAEVTAGLEIASAELAELRGLVREFQAITNPPAAPALAQGGAEEVAAERMADVKAKAASIEVASVEVPVSANSGDLGA